MTPEDIDGHAEDYRRVLTALRDETTRPRGGFAQVATSTYRLDDDLDPHLRRESTTDAR